MHRPPQSDAERGSGHAAASAAATTPPVLSATRPPRPRAKLDDPGRGQFLVTTRDRKDLGGDRSHVPRPERRGAATGRSFRARAPVDPACAESSLVDGSEPGDGSSVEVEAAAEALRPGLYCDGRLGR